MMQVVRKKRSRGRLLLLVSFIVVGMLFGAMMFNKYLGRHEKPSSPVLPAKTGQVAITLFFASQDSEELVPESRNIEACGGNLSQCIQSSLEELATGPLGDLSPAIPQNSTFRSVTIQGDIAVIDMGKELAEGLPKGSSAEMTAIYSVVNTVAFNFPAIKRVKFLVDGNAVATLGGHLTLANPIEPDFHMIKGREAAVNSPAQADN
jgi:spore germination protein GerM